MSYNILIVGSNAKENGVQSRKLGRLLVQGFMQNNIRWEIHFPTEQHLPDLQTYDAIIFWSYLIYRQPQYMESAQRIEARAKALGIPVLNSINNADASHSFFLKRWQAQGICCANVQRFNDFEELNLEYPIIIRRDGVHQGRDVFLVHNPSQAKKLIETRKKDTSQSNFNVAIEFIDTQCVDGYYRKYRSYVIGDQILRRHLHVSKSWLVNFDNSDTNMAIRKEHRNFIEAGEQDEAAIMSAAVATGHEIMALDYSLDKNGKYVFWECNRHFLMAGDSSGSKIKQLFKLNGLNSMNKEQLNKKISQLLFDLEEEKKMDKTINQLQFNLDQKKHLDERISQLITDLEEANQTNSKFVQTLCDLEEERRMDNKISQSLCDLIIKGIQSAC